MQYFCMALIIHVIQLKLSKLKQVSKIGPSNNVYLMLPDEGNSYIKTNRQTGNCQQSCLRDPLVREQDKQHCQEITVFLPSSVPWIHIINNNTAPTS